MSTKSLLDRLDVRSPCKEPWEGMQGEGPERFCARCKKNVLDFAALTPREIRIRLEGSRGTLCGRLTKLDGRLVTQMPPREIPPPSREPRRASPIAAGLVTALVSLSAVRGEAAITSDGGPRSTASAPAEPEGSAPSNPSPAYELHDGANRASMGPEGSVHTESGDFEEAAKDPWQLLEALGDDLVAVAGRISVQLATLPELLASSDLVITATVGDSRVLEKDRTALLVATELFIDEVIHGSASVPSVIYVHSLPVGGSPGGLELHLDRPKGRVLAFLKEAGDQHGTLSGRSFEAADGWKSIKELDADGLDAYRRRLAALVRLLVAAEEAGEPTPEQLQTWRVGTAVNWYTRGEAVGELGEDLSRKHKRRLTAALLATEGVREVDLRLFSLVRSWNPSVANDWLARELPRDTEGSSKLELWHFEDLAEELDSDPLAALVEAAEERRDALLEGVDDEGAADAVEATVVGELRQEFARVLAEEH